MPRKVAHKEGATPPKCEKVEKVGWGENHLITLAYNMSNCDKEFLYMLEGENGAWDMKRQSSVVKNGVREDSWGLCQMHRRWHKNIVDDERFFTSPEWHIEQCYKKWKGGTKFYGYSKRNIVKNHFVFK